MKITIMRRLPNGFQHKLALHVTAIEAESNLRLSDAEAIELLFEVEQAANKNGRLRMWVMEGDAQELQRGELKPGAVRPMTSEEFEAARNIPEE